MLFLRRQESQIRKRCTEKVLPSGTYGMTKGWSIGNYLAGFVRGKPYSFKNLPSFLLFYFSIFLLFYVLESHKTISKQLPRIDIHRTHTAGCISLVALHGYCYHVRQLWQGTNVSRYIALAHDDRGIPPLHHWHPLQGIRLRIPGESASPDRHRNHRRYHGSDSLWVFVLWTHTGIVFLTASSHEYPSVFWSWDQAPRNPRTPLGALWHL